MNWKIVLAIMTCNVVLMSSSYTMLIPFLPLYLRHDLGASADTINIWTGVIFASTFAVCAVMAPIWGKMSDSKGKKLMVIRSSSLIALAYLLGGLVQNPEQLLMVRLFQGFAAGLWPASMTLLSAYTPKNKVGISMGTMQSANICGGILGPLFGGVLAEEWGIRTSFFIAAGALTLITLVTLFLIKEPPKVAVVKKAAAPRNRDLIFRRGFFELLLAGGLANMVILLLQPILAVYVGVLRGTEENIMLISGLVFSLSGIAGAIAAPLWGRRGQSKGFFKTMIFGLFAAGILIAAQSIPNSLMPFAILQFCVGLGFSAIFPSANSLLINVTAPNERGAAFGLFFSAQQIGGTIGPLIGGVIATFISYSFIFFISGCVLIGVGIAVYILFPQHLRGKIEVGDPTLASSSALDDIKKAAARELAQELAQETKQQHQLQKQMPQAQALQAQPLNTPSADMVPSDVVPADVVPADVVTFTFSASTNSKRESPYRVRSFSSIFESALNCGVPKKAM